MRHLLAREEPYTRSQEEPLPASVPEILDAGIAAVYYGQRQAGDFYDFLRVNEKRVLFALLDAAGEVENTRTLLSAAQQTFRDSGAKLFAGYAVNETDAMIDLYHELNRSILSSAQGVHACPGFLACYNEELGLVCYCNAGHTQGLVRDQSGVTELAATGLPLGLFSHATCDAPMVALQPGAALLLVSRGIVEAKQKRRGDEFGLERTKATLQQASLESPRELCVTVLDGVRQFMGTAPTHDDVTALALIRDAGATEP